MKKWYTVSFFCITYMMYGVSIYSVDSIISLEQLKQDLVSLKQLVPEVPKKPSELPPNFNTVSAFITRLLQKPESYSFYRDRPYLKSEALTFQKKFDTLTPDQQNKFTEQYAPALLDYFTSVVNNLENQAKVSNKNYSQKPTPEPGFRLQGIILIISEFLESISSWEGPHNKTSTVLKSHEVSPLITRLTQIGSTILPIALPILQTTIPQIKLDLETQANTLSDVKIRFDEKKSAPSIELLQTIQAMLTPIETVIDNVKKIIHTLISTQVALKNNPFFKGVDYYLPINSELEALLRKAFTLLLSLDKDLLEKMYTLYRTENNAYRTKKINENKTIIDNQKNQTIVYIDATNNDKETHSYFTNDDFYKTTGIDLGTFGTSIAKISQLNLEQMRNNNPNLPAGSQLILDNLAKAREGLVAKYKGMFGPKYRIRPDYKTQVVNLFPVLEEFLKAPKIVFDNTQEINKYSGMEQTFTRLKTRLSKS